MLNTLNYLIPHLSFTCGYLFTYRFVYWRGIPNLFSVYKICITHRELLLPLEVIIINNITTLNYHLHIPHDLKRKAI